MLTFALHSDDSRTHISRTQAANYSQSFRLPTKPALHHELPVATPMQMQKVLHHQRRPPSCPGEIFFFGKLLQRLCLYDLRPAGNEQGRLFRLHPRVSAGARRKLKEYFNPLFPGACLAEAHYEMAGFQGFLALLVFFATVWALHETDTITSAGISSPARKTPPPALIV